MSFTTIIVGWLVYLVVAMGATYGVIRMPSVGRWWARRHPEDAKDLTSVTEAEWDNEPVPAILLWLAVVFWPITVVVVAGGFIVLTWMERENKRTLHAQLNRRADPARYQ